MPQAFLFFSGKAAQNERHGCQHQKTAVAALGDTRGKADNNRNSAKHRQEIIQNGCRSPLLQSAGMRGTAARQDFLPEQENAAAYREQHRPVTAVPVNIADGGNKSRPAAFHVQGIDPVTV